MNGHSLGHDDINHAEIAEKADAILDKFGITEPVVDAVRIANGLGFKVKEITMPPRYFDVAGFYNNKDKTIYVQASDKPWRKLFTVAHEIGHNVLGHKNYEVLFRVQNKDQRYSEVEREANSFAASLLMPNWMLNRYLDAYGLTKKDYREMAKIFGVSEKAMEPILLYLK
ncbi:MAG: ImmA/IrrE family metallo-endopeptidase [Candidatus Pacebacteria bacterium]|nr:ImmA/IrrE family metallo-endopeptidase [Candidatus Paceibacterota bacterium]